MQTYALLGNFNHMIPILKRLLATRWRCDYSCTTPARPDLQRSSFSGIGCGNRERERTHTDRVVSCW